MKKVFHFIPFLSLIIGLVITSCVSSKKFMASEANVDKLQKDNAKTLGLLNDCNTQVKILTDDKNSLKNQNEMAQSDLKVLSTESKMTIADQARRLKNFQDMIQAQKDVMNKLKS